MTPYQVDLQDQGEQAARDHLLVDLMGVVVFLVMGDCTHSRCAIPILVATRDLYIPIQIGNHVLFATRVFGVSKGQLRLMIGGQDG